MQGYREGIRSAAQHDRPRCLRLKMESSTPTCGWVQSPGAFRDTGLEVFQSVAPQSELLDISVISGFLLCTSVCSGGEGVVYYRTSRRLPHILPSPATGALVFLIFTRKCNKGMATAYSDAGSNLGRKMSSTQCPNHQWRLTLVASALQLRFLCQLC